MAAKYAKPVLPNAGVEAWYRDQLQTLVRAMSQDMLDRIKAAWREGGGLAMDAGPGRPKLTTSTLLQRAMAKWGSIWTRRTEAMSTKIAWDFAAKNKDATDAAVKRTLKDAGFTVKFRPTKRIREAYDAVGAWNVDLIKSIPRKYHDDVNAAVWQAVASGGDLKTLSKVINEKYGVAYRRAAFIATDQNRKAKSAIERARRLDNGITVAKWKHSHAGVEPRQTHLDNDGKDYDIREGWYDPAAGARIWPGTLPRCRCADCARIPGFG